MIPFLYGRYSFLTFMVAGLIFVIVSQSDIDLAMAKVIGPAASAWINVGFLLVLFIAAFVIGRRLDDARRAKAKEAAR